MKIDLFAATRFLLPLWTVLLGQALLPAPASAADKTWDGGSNLGDGWSTTFFGLLNGYNWDPDGTNPVTGDNLFFAGSIRTTNTNNTTAGNIYNITFNSGASAFTLNGNSLTLGTGGITNNSTNNQTFGTLPLTLTSTSGNFNAASGNLTVNSAIGGTNGILTKTGANVLTLANTNTYSGATTIHQGTLVVSGSIGSSAVTINNAGTVLASGTTGTIGSSVTVNNGAILAPGGVGPIGTATVGSGGLTMNPGSIFSWDVTSATSFDKVTVGTLSGSNAIFNIVTNISDSFWNGNRTFSGIFSGTTNLAGIFSSIRLNGSTLTGGLVPGRGTFAFDSSVNLKYTAIPEPTSALAGILLVGGLLRRRR
jgi:autotransporter-associated beta strand protein